MKQIYKPMLVYRPEDLVHLIGIGRNTVYALLRSGRIRSVKIGTHYLVTREAVDEFLNGSANDENR